MHRWNQEWLEDASVRLVCVTALDRFGDFVSDEVHVGLFPLKYRFGSPG